MNQVILTIKPTPDELEHTTNHSKPTSDKPVNISITIPHTNTLIAILC